MIYNRLALKSRVRAACTIAAAVTMVFSYGVAASGQTLVNDLGGILTDLGDESVSGQVTQIAFAPGDNTHAYVATFGGGIVRYDYNPGSASNFFSNPLTVVPTATSNQGGVDGSLGIAFHEDDTLGITMYIAPAVPFSGGGGVNSFHDQSIVRLNDAGGNGIFGDQSDLNQNIVDNVNVSQVHQINQLQIRGDTLYAAIGIRTQNGGQTAAENIAIGGSGVDQSDPGETEYTGTVSFIQNLNNIAAGTNSAGFTIANNQTAIKSDAQAFTSTADNKLRVYATGFRNNYGIAIDDSGEMWVSMNQNENPNAPDELHRNVTFQSDHQFFKGNDIVGNWKTSGHASAVAAQNAGYFSNSVPFFASLDFNTAAGGLDFFAPDTSDVSLQGDVLQSRNSGSGQDVFYVDKDNAANSFVVLEGLSGALEVQRDPFGNFLAGGSGKVTLLGVGIGILGDFDSNGVVNLVDWNLFKPNFWLDTSGMSVEDARLAGDLDVSGRVDMDDANQFAQIFADAGGSLAQLHGQVPEPGALLLFLLGTAGLLAMPVRRRM